MAAAEDHNDSSLYTGRVLAKIAADLLVLFHLAFILFVAAGGLLALRWPRVVWAHLPAAVWGALIELNGWLCPLTPLENRLRLAGGDAGYSGGFIDHYIMPIIYPAGLTHELQVVLGCTVIIVNGLVYGVLILRRARRKQVPGS
jgi:hypothetical protein